MNFYCTPLTTYCQEHLPDDIIATILVGHSYYYSRFDEVKKRRTTYPIKKELLWNLYDYESKSFPSGFMSKIIWALEERGLSYNIDMKQNVPVKAYDFSQQFNDYLRLTNREVRYFQKEATEAIKRYYCGLILIGTGGGKTLFYGNTINELGLKTIVITIDLSSKAQTATELKMMLGEDSIGMIDQDDYADYPVVVANIQNIWAKRENKEFLDYAKTVDLLIVNETHHVNESKLSQDRTLENTWYAATQLIPAYYRIGATGTAPAVGSIARHLLTAAIGEVLYVKTTRELIDEGYATPIECHVYHIPSNNSFHTDYVKAYEFMLSEPQFNETISYIAKYYAYKNKRVIIFCDWVEKQVIKLESLLYDKCIVVHGGIKAKLRPDLIKRFEQGEKNILIGTVFSEDFNLPAIDVGIIIGKKKNENSIKQRTGRMARLFVGKEKGIVVIPFVQDYKEVVIKGKQKFVNGKLAEHSEEALRILEREGHTIVHKNLDDLKKFVNSYESENSVVSQ